MRAVAGGQGFSNWWCSVGHRELEGEAKNRPVWGDFASHPLHAALLLPVLYGRTPYRNSFEEKS